MLIACIPHSSSSSLQQAFGDVTGLNTSNCSGAPLRRQFKRVGKKLFRRHTPGWYGIRCSGCVQVPKVLLSLWATERHGFYRSHLLPLKEHIESLRAIGSPVVVHLRDPKSTLEARSRRKGRSGVASKSAFDDFVRFNEGWEKVREEELFLLTSFQELVTDPAATINRMLEHFGVEERADADYTLPRKYYTGEGLRALEDEYRQDDEGHSTGACSETRASYRCGRIGEHTSDIEAPLRTVRNHDREIGEAK